MTTKLSQKLPPVLSVERLSIDISHEHHTQRVVDDLSFHQGDPGDWYLIDTPASFLAIGDTIDP